MMIQKLLLIPTIVFCISAAPATQPVFTQALAPREWAFPRDHGRHDGFKTEWWYFTGNLRDETGRPFGYQLTFFRTSFIAKPAIRQSPWAMTDLYFAHAAISDISGKQFVYADKMARGREGFAYSSDRTLDVVLLDWQCVMKDDGIHLIAKHDALAIDLVCQAGRGPVLQGSGGLNPKGVAAGQASYYYSMTRLPTKGTLTIKSKKFTVSGLSWMDHEFSSNALAANQSGWDWLALTLDDGCDVMVYRLRDKAGNTDYLSGTQLDASGKSTLLQAADIQLTASSPWKSPRSGGAYPQHWRLKIKDGPVMMVRTRIDDQELQTPDSTQVTYYEGAVEVRDEKEKPIGQGYLEMTGYAKSMGGAF